MWAEAFADAQNARIAFENKFGQSVDGKERRNAATVDPDAFGPVLELYKESEERLRGEMVACYRVTVPAAVRRWQEETAGIGESTLARLLGAIGDPRMAYPRHWEGSGSAKDGEPQPLGEMLDAADLLSLDRGTTAARIGVGRHLVDDEPHPRSIGQLWQYCGHGAPKNRDVKGNAAALMANGRPDAKKLVWMMASAQVKTNAKGGSGYRHVYDAVKAKYSEKVHSVPCTGGYSGSLYVKCKTHLLTPDDVVAQFQNELEDDAAMAEFLDSKKPRKGYAEAGDPYQPSHIHAIALRLTGKEILRDLWLAAGEEA